MEAKAYSGDNTWSGQTLGSTQKGRRQSHQRVLDDR